jgi:hypothetical protein
MNTKPERRSEPLAEQPSEKPGEPATKPAAKPREIGGPKGPEPTRYGDWENKGIASDF